MCADVRVINIKLDNTLNRCGVSKARQFLNFPALVTEVSAAFPKPHFNVVPFYAERHSLEDTARVFRASSVIVAAHGAGLTNMYYAREGTVIIEVVFNIEKNSSCTEGIRSHFIAMATNMGMSHYSVVDESTSCPNYAGPFTAPVEKILTTLHSLHLSPRRSTWKSFA
tara:strand:- start:168 stop:671 length:504 start_codon:yes stop_codon:yes gene_type:complete